MSARTMTDHKNLAAALVAFQSEMPTVAKTKTANVGQYRYTYADLADVMEAAAPILTRHGLAYTGSARHVEAGRYEVVGILSHESGEMREGALPLAAGGTPQQMGSAITYARRYLAGLLTGIVTDKDDDGSLASAQQEQKRERRAATSKPPAPVEDAKPDPADGAMTAKTRGRLFALFGERGIDDRDEQIRGIAHVIGRPIASRSELTEDEARAVIARLTQAETVTGEGGAA